MELLLYSNQKIKVRRWDDWTLELELPRPDMYLNRADTLALIRALIAQCPPEE